MQGVLYYRRITQWQKPIRPTRRAWRGSMAWRIWAEAITFNHFPQICPLIFSLQEMSLLKALAQIVISLVPTSTNKCDGNRLTESYASSVFNVGSDILDISRIDYPSSKASRNSIFSSSPPTGLGLNLVTRCCGSVPSASSSMSSSL